MTEAEILTRLQEVNVLLTGDHFVLTSDRHSADYVNKDILYAHTNTTSLLGLLIAQQFLSDQIDVVVGPALGGIALSQWVTYQLDSMTRGDEVLAVYAEKAEGGFVIKRGYDRLIPEKRALVVEDILTTGGSVNQVIKAVRALGGVVAGVGTIWNRGGVTAQDLGVPKLFSLVNRELPSWSAEECARVGPCSRGVRINTEVGKGREFLAAKK